MASVASDEAFAKRLGPNMVFDLEEDCVQRCWLDEPGIKDLVKSVLKEMRGIRRGSAGTGSGSWVDQDLGMRTTENIHDRDT